jgi:putative FmdB family regulatory protein
MPIYEYLCEDCRTKFEKFVRYPDREQIECPSCGKNHLQQLISRIRMHEKGKVRDTSRPSWAEHVEYQPPHDDDH